MHENVTVLRQAERVLGFVGPADYSPSGEAHMGVDIGVHGSVRGKGLGNVILYTFLQMLKDHGARECMIYGVGPRRYYSNAGVVTRPHAQPPPSGRRLDALVGFFNLMILSFECLAI